ncbi:MAG TPA: hypothetical protein VHA56_16330 [Mucilaginibacter sp.]|nr:hypothetical protein [Mucilaginibacter sp.]
MAKSAKSNWSKGELKKIRSALPPGWSAMLAERHGLSIGTVENIMYGSQQNDEVVLSAIKAAEERRILIESNKEKIKSL